MRLPGWQEARPALGTQGNGVLLQGRVPRARAGETGLQNRSGPDLARPQTRGVGLYLKVRWGQVGILKSVRCKKGEESIRRGLESPVGERV